jgi:ferredoxin
MKISKGNSKLGAIPNISMTPIKACANCSACRRECYALKAYRQYPATRKAWDHNLAHARRDPRTYFAQIHSWIACHGPEFFRWHVAGDILSQSYLEHMSQVANCYPGTRFLCFTKRGDLDYSRVPDNLRIRFSQWPGSHRIGALNAWMQDGTETRIPKNALKCPGSCADCKACFNNTKDVYFNKH